MELLTRLDSCSSKPNYPSNESLSSSCRTNKYLKDEKNKLIIRIWLDSLSEESLTTFKSNFPDVAHKYTGVFISINIRLLL